MRVAAIHEAAHAVGFMQAGVPVRELVISDDGSGRCVPSREPDDPWARLVISFAGASAPTLLGLPRGELSVGSEAADLEHGNKAWLDLWSSGFNVSLEQAQTLADDFVWLHRQGIAFLAERLLAKRYMLRDAIAGVVHQDGSPLSSYRHLYAKPRPPRRRTVMGFDVQAEPGWRNVSPAGGLLG